MRKRFLTIISVLMVAVMSIMCVSCGANEKFGGDRTPDSVDNTQQLAVIKSDIQIDPADTLSRIKAEYLKENNGYKDGDEVVAILSLADNALIDSYLEGETSAALADYVKTSEGRAQAKSLANKQDKLIRALKKDDLILDVEYNYTTIVNAVAVRTTYGNFKKLEKSSLIESAMLSDTFNRPQAEDAGSSANTIVNDVDVYPDTGIFNSGSVDYTGKKTSVAVLDSGFDCSHSIFNTAIPADDELYYTRDEITAYLNSSTNVLNAAKTTRGLRLEDVWYSNKIPYKYDYADKDYDVNPYDSEHGTHVAGIIGGYDDVITGVAIHTQLVLMKVFADLTTGAKTEDLLAALEDSAILGVDAINMSLGASCGFAREKDGELVNDIYGKIEAAGISLITAAGNEHSSSYGGEQGNTNFTRNPDSGTVGSPSSYEAALSVASVSGVKSNYLYCNSSDVIFFKESNKMNGKPNDFFGEIFAALGVSGDEPVELDYVTVPGVGLAMNFSAIDVKGKIALIRRGNNTFEEKAQNAKNAGALACIIFNNVEGDISMSMGKSDHIPTVSITKADGTRLAERSTGKIRIAKSYAAGPFMSDFSNWGPLPDLQLKPEITAHGGNIKSSVPGGGYDELSGTSMASPNLCGIVVLIRQFLREKYPELENDPKLLTQRTNSFLMSTATTVFNEAGIPYSPRKQGAGLASLKNVVYTDGYLEAVEVDAETGGDIVKDRPKLELWDDPDRTGVYNMNFNVVNVTESEVNYRLGIIAMTESVSTSDDTHVAEMGHILYEGGVNGSALGASVKEGTGSLTNGVLTVPALGTARVSLTYTLTNEDKAYIDKLFGYGMYVEGFVTLENTASGTEENPTVSLNMPFLGFYGDWTQAPMFDKTNYEVESEAHNAAIDDDKKIKADYYATTLYGQYYQNYIIPFGTYLYTMPYGYDPIPASEEHAAVSEAYGSIQGFSGVYAGLLRGAKEMNFSIIDNLTGETVWEFTETNMRKAHSNGGSPIPGFKIFDEEDRTSTAELGLINNRQYEFKMQGLLDYGDGGLTTNARNSFSLNFYCDTEAPIVKDAVFETTYDRSLKKNRYYVTLTIYDNHYVQSVSPVAFTSSNRYSTLSEMPIPVYSEKGTDNNVRIEITDYMDDLYDDVLATHAIGFAVDDYAMNNSLYVCPLPGTRGGFSFKAPDNKNYISIEEGEVLDLTQYLMTEDDSVDGDFTSTDGHYDPGKNYLSHLNWKSSDESKVIVREGQILGVSSGNATITVDNANANGWDFGEKYGSASIVVRVTKRKDAQSANNAASAGELTSALKSANNADNAADATLEELSFKHFVTQFAYDRSNGASDLYETGARVYMNSLDSAGTYKTFKMYPGEKVQLFYNVSPWYVEDNYDFTFSSAQPGVVKIDEKTGELEGVSKGTSLITLTARHKKSGVTSNIRAYVRITVESPFIIENRSLIAYKGKGDENGVVVIPDDEGIFYIGSYAFSLYTADRDVKVDEDDWDANKTPGTNPYIKKVVIPEGVEDIQKYAFYNCPNLTEVVIPESCKYIREFAFSGAYTGASDKLVDNGYATSTASKLTDIDLKNVHVIGAFAFAGVTTLKTIDLSHVYAIGVGAFMNSGLETANLTALRNTGELAFAHCPALGAVTLHDDTRLSVMMFMSSALETVSIGEKVQIPDGCFKNCTQLTSVTFRNDPVIIGAQAFCGCSKLEAITLPSVALSIGDGAFAGCSSLAALTFGADTSFKEFGAQAFDGAPLTTVTTTDSNVYKSENGLLLSKDGKTVIMFFGDSFDGNVPAGVETIGENAFARYEGKTIVLPESVKRIEANAFGKLTSINLENVEYIGAYSLVGAELAAVTLKDGAYVGEGAFVGAEIETLNIGENVELAPASFYGAKLATVNMPTVLAYMGEAAFYGAKIEAIDLSRLTEIPAQAFYGARLPSSVDLSAAETVGVMAFAKTNVATVTFGEGLKNVDAAAFSTTSVTALSFGSSLESIGDNAFEYCRALESVDMSDCAAVEIGAAAFAADTALTTVTLSDSQLSLPENVFNSCTALTTINLANVKTIGAGAFYQTTALGEVNLSAAEEIGENAFAYNLNSQAAGGLTMAVNAPNLVKVGALAFSNTLITSVNAPKLEEIGAMAFAFTSNLEKFTFSDKIAYVGPTAFYGAEKLEFAFMDGTTEKKNGRINDYAFLDSGALYITLPSGKYQLMFLPHSAQVETFTVVEGTVRIDELAASFNESIKKLILPDSLVSIGQRAFFYDNALETVEFRSVTAPALENFYSTNRGSIGEDSPSYDVLYAYSNLLGDLIEYYNFVGQVGTVEPLKMILPANKDISGYDSIIYEAYFGKVENATRSSYVAMEANLVAFLDYATRIAAIDTLTLYHYDLVNDAVIAYTALTQSGTDYGYTKEEWDAIVKTVTDAREKLTAMRWAAATKQMIALRDEFNSLPTEYKPELKERMDAATVALNKLKSDEKSMLNLSNYNALIMSYNKYLQEQKPPVTPPGTGDPPKGPGDEEGPGDPEPFPTWALVVSIVVPSAVVLLGAGAFLAWWFLKKKKKA